MATARIYMARVRLTVLSDRDDAAALAGELEQIVKEGLERAELAYEIHAMDVEYLAPLECERHPGAAHLVCSPACEKMPRPTEHKVGI